MITAEKIKDITMDCLFTNEEMEEVNHETPENAVVVNGIVNKFGFHKERLESHREEVKDFLNEMDKVFHVGHGGGMTFLNLCNDKNGNMWTGLHQAMESLLVLSMGLNMAKYCFPREDWGILPGGMPYIVFDVNGFEERVEMPM